jgi:hypothetical protein
MLHCGPDALVRLYGGGPVSITRNFAGGPG